MTNVNNTLTFFIIAMTLISCRGNRSEKIFVSGNHKYYLRMVDNDWYFYYGSIVINPVHFHYIRAINDSNVIFRRLDNKGKFMMYKYNTDKVHARLIGDINEQFSLRYEKLLNGVFLDTFYIVHNPVAWDSIVFNSSKRKLKVDSIRAPKIANLYVQMICDSSFEFGRSQLVGEYKIKVYKDGKVISQRLIDVYYFKLDSDHKFFPRKVM